MSFRCQKCGGARPNKEFPAEFSPRQVVVKTRTHADHPGKKIVQEMKVCASCATIIGEPTNEVVGTSAVATTRGNGLFIPRMPDEAKP